MRASNKGVARDIIQGMLNVSKLSTIRGIYERIEPGKDGHIRSWMSPVGTETGRFAHSDTFLEASTNLGNLPKKQALYDALYNVRDCIIADEGRMLWEVDLSQAEARVAAWMSHDALAMKQYEDGVDRYKFFAAHLYHDGDISKVSKLERNTVGKEGILSCQYMVEWMTIMRRVNMMADLTGVSINAKLAKAMVALFRELYPGYIRWWEEVKDEVATNGYLETPFGRKRIFMGRAERRHERKAVQREAVAYLPQSTIADHLNDRLVELYERYDPSPLRITLQVHDAIVGDCNTSDVTAVAVCLKTILEAPLTIRGNSLVIPAEVTFGTSWGKMKEVA